MDYHLDPERRAWRRGGGEQEFLWLRLSRTIEQVQTAISRIHSAGDPADAATLAALERLREDLVAALALVAERPPAEG